MAWLTKLLSDGRKTDVDVLIVQAVVILSGLASLLLVLTGVGLDAPSQLVP